MYYLVQQYMPFLFQSPIEIRIPKINVVIFIIIIAKKQQLLYVYCDLLSQKVEENTCLSKPQKMY